MERRVLIRANAYYDSVSLMSVSKGLSGLDGVTGAVVVMGTEMNKELLGQVGLLTDAAAAATPSDLVIAVAARSAGAAESALKEAERLLRRADGGGQTFGSETLAPATIRAACKATPGANLALISVPGVYAAREAHIALEQGLDVMLFSDNVSLEDEVRLKRLALAKGLLLMGPDCGTAILNGVGLGFANAVRRGSIGIVAASGTGAQEISCLVDGLGGGISQLIGTGGRDLSAAVGGLMALEGLRRLQADAETRVILLVSKPPAPAVAGRLQVAAGAGPKPVVLCFLGEEGALSLDGAAQRAVALAGHPGGGGADGAAGRAGLAPQAPQAPLAPRASLAPQAFAPLALAPGRTDVRGLFSGGTLCDQALFILERELGPVTCNIHPNPARRGGEERSAGHTLLDLGDDRYTSGRAHPMIDPTLRRMRLLQEAEDPATAVILLDIVLGYGAHPDPSGALADAITAAAAQGVAVVASVTGTESDSQGRSRQEAILRAAGAVVAPTARLAAEQVAAALKQVKGPGQTVGASPAEGGKAGA